MYLYDKNRITYFAETDRRNKRIPFGIKAEDRTRHMYIIGKTGMGKSTLIENMAVQDIKNGEGFAFIDPHGKSAALLLEYIPPERMKDVIYFAPFDMDNPISFNIMEDIGPDKRHLVANGLMSVFKKIWVDAWSARMEYILSNVLLALLEYPGSTLLGVNRMLADKAYRKKVVDNIKDLSVKSFWVDEYAKYSEKYAQEATPAIQNKIGQFTSNPLIRNIIGQSISSFDIRKIMDEKKILIVNLSKGLVGEGNANLLGSMLITKIYLAAMSRADLPESELQKLPNFYMYVDEFQSFANESFANILSEARKYKLSLVMAHQYIEQMSEEVTAAVFGNVGTQIMLRVGATDAEKLEKEYAPVFTAEDMVNLGMYQIYLKLMIDGVASHPFSAVTLPPIPPQKNSLREQVIASSRELYGHPRAKVEKDIADWFGTEMEEKAPVQSVPYVKREPVVTPTSYSAKSEEKSEPRREYAPVRPREPRIEATPRPPAPREEAQRVKTDKPFAKAFQDLVQPPVQEKLPLSALSSAKIERTTTFTIKGKGPSEEGLNSLKSALAGVLKEHEFKKEALGGPTAKLEKAPVSSPPVLRTLPISSTPKLGETPVISGVLGGPTAKSKEEKREEPPREKEIKEKEVKEVPEDVLTAILRGDD